MSRVPDTAATPPFADRAAAAFRDTIERLHRRLGGAPDDTRVVGEWAERMWSASSDGHVCLMLPAASGERAGRADEPAPDHPIVAQLAASPAVTRDPAVRPAPLVLDRHALYLHRWWQAEVRLARTLAALDRAMPAGPPHAVDAALDAVFPKVAHDDGQRLAAALALTRRLAVITGGPGTGKTTTLARLLVAFLALKPDARVAFAAPTGKAAARLAQSLATQLPELHPDGRAAARLPSSGLTVHRLLGRLDDRYGEGPGRLVFDLVIVDEASMLDVELAARLAQAIPDHGRLVLAGDRDQLASVEAGAVFSELCAGAIHGMRRLTVNYRQADAPKLAALAAALRDGDALAVRGALAAGASTGSSAHAASAVRALDATGGARTVADAALRGYGPALDAIAAGAPARDVLERFDDYRVLCALRGGPMGTIAINRAIADTVRRRVGAAPGADWYPGRLVMIARNEPDLGLFNGDVGVCLRRPAPEAFVDVDAGADAGDGRSVERADRNANRNADIIPAAPAASGPLAVAFVVGGALRWTPVAQMPACDDAFAITVHKSQGSEFDCAAVVPAPAGHALNTRELVYTAVTRARSRLVVWADVAVLAEAAAQRTSRAGLLADRIAADAQAVSR